MAATRAAATGPRLPWRRRRLPGYTPQQDYEQQQGYLQGGPVDFQGAIRHQFDNVLNFNGRASRSAYWWYALALFIVDVVLQIISARGRLVGPPCWSASS